MHMLANIPYSVFPWMKYSVKFALQKSQCLSFGFSFMVSPVPEQYCSLGCGWAHRQGVRRPTLFKIRHVALHPPQDRRMSKQDAALGHHLGEVTGTELESEIRSHTQNDDLLVKVPSLNRSCAEVCSVIPAVIAGYRDFQQFAPEPFPERWPVSLPAHAP
jgi:hypothetical protein